MADGSCEEPAVDRRIANWATTQPRRGLDREESAIYVGVTLATFDQMVIDGRLPKPSDFDGEMFGILYSSTGHSIG